MKLLLHICCAPCAVYPLEVLKSEGISPEGFFYNPNIHPKDEFIKRMQNVKILSEIKSIAVNYDNEFLQEKWEQIRDEKVDRCDMCYQMRMRKTAEYAKAKGFDTFTTTLLVSPYQNHDFIKTICFNLAKEFGLTFFYKDFRVGFREGQAIAKEMGLYRQKYCGCILSK
jgi:epoxyqueuosine reductase